jgi:hypothetical protein
VRPPFAPTALFAIRGVQQRNKKIRAAALRGMRTAEKVRRSCEQPRDAKARIAQHQFQPDIQSGTARALRPKQRSVGASFATSTSLPPDEVTLPKLSGPCRKDALRLKSPIT